MDKHEKLVNSSYLGLALFIYSNLHSPSSIIESIVCCVIFYSIKNNCVPVHMTLIHVHLHLLSDVVRFSDPGGQAIHIPEKNSKTC